MREVVFYLGKHVPSKVCAAVKPAGAVKLHGGTFPGPARQNHD
ncbi:hypothetical protein [Desulfovibrio desulfuricans]|nr:hypothetical protein [Desulfovibrio desulfuricans]